jgi:putative ABC transport system substrate-binding protein
MNRRAFIGTLAGGVLAAPIAADAQQSGKVWRIGILGYTLPTSDMVGPEPRHPIVNAFVRGLRDLGYVYGQHFVTEPRGAEGRLERFPSLVAELVSLKVDVIVAVGNSQQAVKEATSTIPVVMAGSGDPVMSGFVESLSRPGTNFTGLTFLWLDLIGKRLELLKQIVPTATPVAVLWDRASYRVWEAAEAAARQQGWRLLSLPIGDIAEIEGAFRMATKARAGALLAAAPYALDPRPQLIVALAAKNRIPTMYHQRYFVEFGGLLSYAPDLADIWRRAATFVDKIIKGANPAELPVEQPTKFDLVINLKTAKALGLTIPPSLLQRAHQLIE